MTERPFLPRLEALRGLAALMVAYSHSLEAIVINHPSAEWVKLVLKTVGNGDVAVTLFFVLSGYVLGHSLDHGGTGYAAFMIRRMLRVWPAMLASLAGCYVWLESVHAAGLVRHFDAAAPLYYEYWQHPASWQDLLRDAFFLGNYLNPVTWTLEVEMLAAALFIPLWRLSRRSPSLAALLLLGWAGCFLGMPLQSYARVGFVYMLLLGMQAGPGARWAQRHLSVRQQRFGLWLAYIGCCLANKWLPVTLAAGWFLESLFGYAVVALLVASHSGVPQPLLDSRLMRCIGRISFGFYLWHFPVMFTLGSYGFALLDPSLCLRWPNALGTGLFLASTVCALPLAWFSHRFVESPFLALAKVLTRHRSVGGLPSPRAGKAAGAFSEPPV